MSEDADEPPFDYLGLRFDEQELFAYDQEPSAHILYWSGTVVYWDEDDEENVVNHPIGSFRATVVNAVGAINAGESLFDVFDTEQSTFDYYKALYNDATNQFTDQVLKAAFRHDYPLTLNLLILERLAILPEYRGKGRGLMVLRGLMQYLGAGIGLMAMNPFPLQGEREPFSAEEAAERQRLKLDELPRDMRKATAKLVHHYGRLGFVRLPKTPYLVRDGTLPLPGPDELGLV